MLLKLIGYGIETFFRDILNFFDALIVLAAWADWVLTYQSIKVESGILTVISVFRMLRLFRMFKLARSWTKFR